MPATSTVSQCAWSIRLRPPPEPASRPSTLVRPGAGSSISTARPRARSDSAMKAAISFSPGAPGEKEIAAFIAESLRARGLAVEILEPAPGRTSVLGRLAGSGGGRSLMLHAHCDTVDVAGMAEPFSGATRDGKLYGRGAYDMKGSLAACMAAAKALQDSGTRLRGDLLVAAVADEEYGSLGTSDLLAHVIPHGSVDGAILTEPTR